MQSQKNDHHFLDAAFQTLTPPANLTVAEWCEQNIILPELTCPEPGPFRIARTPYVRGPLDAFGSVYIECIVLVWGRQNAKSTVIHLCSAYTIAEDPGPIMFLFPDQKLGEYTSKNRLQPLYEGCKAVMARRTPEKNDYTKMEMKFIGSILSIAWGGSGSQVMSRPVRVLVVDEVDELGDTVGEGESSPLKSAWETTSNFGNRKIILTSTPSTQENHIWQNLKTCQRVFEYWIPCPHCGAYQVMIWEQIKWPGDIRDPQSVNLMVWYECEHCQGKISNLAKIRALAHGQWRARLVDNPADSILKGKRVPIEQTVSFDEVLLDSKIKKVGFHLPQWYSPFPNATMGHVVQEFLEAQGDFLKMRDWTKFKRALPWVDRVETREYKDLVRNKIDLPPLVCPADTVALTCTADPGQGGFWYAVIAWQRDTSRHVVQYGFIVGWDALTQLCFQNTYEVAGSGGGRLRIWRDGVDTGGSEYGDAAETMTEAAYDWIRKNMRQDLFGVRGSSNPIRGGRRMNLTIVDKMPGPQGKPIPGGLAVWYIDTDQFKDAIQYHLQVAPGDPGSLTFHSETREDIFSHILAEEKVRDKHGKTEWKKKRQGNHLLDCLVYGFALADPECNGGYKVLPMPVFRKVQRQEENGKSSGWLAGVETLSLR